MTPASPSSPAKRGQRRAPPLDAGVDGEVGESPISVLVVDDEPTLRRSLARVLLSRGMHVLTADDGQAALEVLAEKDLDVALVDLMMPRVGGMELLQHVKSQGFDVEVIMMTAFGDVETAVKTVRLGAHNFLTKPFRSPDEVVVAVIKAAEHRRLRSHARRLRERLADVQGFGQLVGSSAVMREVYRLALGVAPTEACVLILGESGTGKELVARAIHGHSRRRDQAFVAINCAAIPLDLLESELFGHEAGAFTGAGLARPGLFQAADGGSVFLDEIGDLPLSAQAKLLRVLQEGEVKAVGANTTTQVDVRVLCATNVDLREQISRGAFREDLYYRINVIGIDLPPLRQRSEDIPMLAQHFLRKHAGKAGREIRGFSTEAMARLRRHPFLGNVRELENTIEHAVVFCTGDVIDMAHLPPGFSAEGESVRAPGDASWSTSLLDAPFPDAKERALVEFETAYAARSLEQSGGNVAEAARKAGLDRSNFRRLLRRRGLLKEPRRR